MFSNELTEEQRAEYEEIFNDIDADGSGKITSEELSTAMKSIGQNPTEEQVLAMIHEFDDDGDNQIDLQEFL